MIQLTRLNQKALIVNSDMIEFIENSPDTVISLMTGKKLVVLESVDQILERIVEYRRRLLPAASGFFPPVLPGEPAEDAVKETD
jgi:flagellar protein FlbD